LPEQEDQSQQDTNNLEDEEFPSDDNGNNEEKKIREDIARDFYVLISRIKTPFVEIFKLRSKKVKPGDDKAKKLGIRVDKVYFLLTEDEEQDFFRYLTQLNETLGNANSTLDSYIKFTKSSPDFEKFLNMFFIFVENYTAYRATIFFQAHAEQGHYLYPYYEVDNVLVKLQFLFARLCGTLSVGARWTMIQPPSSHSSGGFEGGYGGGIDPYRSFGDAYTPYGHSYGESKPKSRDIGDVFTNEG
jgi:hypothetical protein